MKSIVLCGGGTAGHIMPLIALRPELEKKFDNIIFIGSEAGMEKDISKANNLEFYAVPTVKFARHKVFENFRIPFKLLDGISKAKAILKGVRPDAIFSKGGYVALPTVIAGKSLNIPVIAHESDYTIGLANKVSLMYVERLLTSFENTSKHKKAFFIGNPLREQIFNGDGQKVKKLYNFNNKPVLLIVGGSIGAKPINECLKLSLPALIESFNIIHIIGKNGAIDTEVLPGYVQLQFANDIENYLNCADVVVSRAGANFAQEILALQKKVLFIPLPKGSSRGDQVLNAIYYKNNNNCELLMQEDLSPQTLLASIVKTYKSTFAPYKYDLNLPKKIVEIIYNFTV